jgi:hypothetical protein
MELSFDLAFDSGSVGGTGNEFSAREQGPSHRSSSESSGSSLDAPQSPQPSDQQDHGAWLNTESVEDHEKGHFVHGIDGGPSAASALGRPTQAEEAENHQHVKERGSPVASHTGAVVGRENMAHGANMSKVGNSGRPSRHSDTGDDNPATAAVHTSDGASAPVSMPALTRSPPPTTTTAYKARPDDFALIKVVGRGAFGKVLQARTTKQTSRYDSRLLRCANAGVASIVWQDVRNEGKERAAGSLHKRVNKPWFSVSRCMISELWLRTTSLTTQVST